MDDHYWTEEGATMVKALLSGTQDEHVRARAIDYLIKELGAADKVALVPGQPDLTAFNTGRQWFARQLQIARVVTLDNMPKRERHDERITGRIKTATERSAERDNRR